jgi:hypothetical protein
MKTAVGYTRVSSSSQASPEKTSLERQAEKIELQARLKEYKLLKIYREPGISGIIRSNASSIDSFTIARTYSSMASLASTMISSCFRELGVEKVGA